MSVLYHHPVDIRIQKTSQWVSDRFLRYTRPTRFLLCNIRSSHLPTIILFRCSSTWNGSSSKATRCCARSCFIYDARINLIHLEAAHHNVKSDWKQFTAAEWMSLKLASHDIAPLGRTMLDGARKNFFPSSTDRKMLFRARTLSTDGRHSITKAVKWLLRQKLSIAMSIEELNGRIQSNTFGNTWWHVRRFL